jgi:polyferredoxin
MVEGARVYNEAAYRAAFFWLVVSAALSIIVIALSRETYCRMRDI